jgi:hypothetical protein
MKTQIEQRQARTMKLVSQCAKELRLAGYKARADHGMVQVIVKVTDLELIRLQPFFNVALVTN